ncbi:hypothetical protein K1X76_07080 [bacterium]|nr:hypothetical protein [bacterium]
MPSEYFGLGVDTGVNVDTTGFATQTLGFSVQGGYPIPMFIGSYNIRPSIQLRTDLNFPNGKPVESNFVARLGLDFSFWLSRYSYKTDHLDVQIMAGPRWIFNGASDTNNPVIDGSVGLHYGNLIMYGGPSIELNCHANKEDVPAGCGMKVGWMVQY